MKFEKTRLSDNDYSSFCQNIIKLIGEKSIIEVFFEKDTVISNSKTILSLGYGFTTRFGFEEFKHCVNGGTVCADSTFGTNKYGYLFVTFSIVDNRQCGVPFLSFLTTTEKNSALVPLLREFKAIIGFEPRVNYFMSDLCPNFYNSWCEIFNHKPVWLYCDWHFVKAVDKILLQLVMDKTEYKEIREIFYKLKNTSEDTMFQTRLEKFISLIGSKNKKFPDYFTKTYSRVSERWDSPYRALSPVNTNMFAEAIYSVFKTHFFKEIWF